MYQTLPLLWHIIYLQIDTGLRFLKRGLIQRMNICKMAKNRYIWIYTEFLGHPVTEMVYVRSRAVSIAYLTCRWPAIFFHDLSKMRNFRFSVTPISLQQCCFWADMYIFSCADRAFISGSTDAIGVQMDAGIQKIRCKLNMLHHPHRKRPKMRGFGPTLWKWAGLEVCH